MRILIGVQARSESSRFPGKIYQNIGEQSMLEMVYEQCKKGEVNNKALSSETKILGHYGDGNLEDFCREKDLNYLMVDCDENDLGQRYLTASDGYDAVVRVTADCPFVGPELIKLVISRLLDFDYVTNTSPRTYVDGLDVQAMSTKALEWYVGENRREEHLFYRLENNCDVYDEFSAQGFKTMALINPEVKIENPFLTKIKVSVDTKEDLERCRKVYAELTKKK